MEGTIPVTGKKTSAEPDYGRAAICLDRLGKRGRWKQIVLQQTLGRLDWPLTADKKHVSPGIPAEKYREKALKWEAIVTHSGLK